MYGMVFNITVGAYRINTLESVTIKRSVETLSDTAVIVLPGSVSNQALNIEEKIKCGNDVQISLGYGKNLYPEFSGYLSDIVTDGGSITLACEDAVFLYRKNMKDEEMKDIPLKNLLEQVNNQMTTDPENPLKLECRYDIKFEKFVIRNMTGYDVLKKIQNEIRPDIYLKGNTLYVHDHFLGASKKLTYDFTRNIEAADLKYRKEDDRILEIAVEMKGKDGKMITKEAGKKGGETITRKLSGLDEAALQKIADEELNRRAYTGYEGYIQTWLAPFCQPGYAAIIKDEENEYAEGTFYVTSVETHFSGSGGVRKITLGKKLNDE